MKLALLGSSAMALAAGGADANNGDPAYLSYDGGAAIVFDSGPSTLNTPGASVGLSFEGISQYDTRALNGGFSFIPPDTMGAIGATQFMETTNGGYAVYDKRTGAQTLLESDGTFWTKAGQVEGTYPNGLPLANGDSRVLFDGRSQRWIVESFAATLDKIQIAVSNTSDATGGWKSTTFTGFAGGIADYPTLAIDDKAVYIGTNDFTPVAGGGFSYAGETLSVINRNDLFGPSAPHVGDIKQFFTSLPALLAGNDRGYALQGVNQTGNTTGKIVAVGANDFGLLTYDINKPGKGNATQGAVTLLSPNSAYDVNGPGRQPYTTGTGDPRVIDTLDDRVSSAVWEQNGKIYAVHTITPTGTDHTEVQWQVIDAASNTILATGAIGGNGDGYDYYQGSIAVNSSGQVVIGYDRSGTDVTTGKISVFAQSFNSLHGGGLTSTGTFLLHVSNTDSYHNGSTDGLAAAGRQRWGDYSQVSLDPNNGESFWVIGQFAREFNDVAGGHPGGTGGSRWGTWITDLVLSPVRGDDDGGSIGNPGGDGGSRFGKSIAGLVLSAVPEPATWSMMLIGFGLVGGALRRRVAKTA